MSIIMRIAPEALARLLVWIDLTVLVLVVSVLAVSEFASGFPGVTLGMQHLETVSANCTPAEFRQCFVRQFEVKSHRDMMDCDQSL